MFELTEEKNLMNSSDNSVKLTSHRIIYDSDKGRQQIMLDEFVSYELKHNSIGAYGIIFFSFAALAVVITINKITNYNEGQVFFYGRPAVSLFE